jgi:hypothetical protein
MDDQGEFDFEEQAEHLERVSSRIGAAIVTFCKEHQRFYAEELRRFVTSETGVSAPASADRVLRHLRQRGVLSYEVLDRRLSLYEVYWVRSSKN